MQGCISTFLLAIFFMSFASLKILAKPGVNKKDLSPNLEEVLLKNPSLSSKKVLIPYLKKGEFNNLNVVFSHIPKWFDTN